MPPVACGPLDRTTCKACADALLLGDEAAHGGGFTAEPDIEQLIAQALALLRDARPLGCIQLGIDSDLLSRLNAEDETPDGPTWVSIWTTQDRTVTPPESARLEGALNLPVQSVCGQARIGHGDLPRDPFVQAMILAQLAPGEPVALDEDDCASLGG